ncbi:MAG TPA: ABC transporter ATP-binding protein, partial [Micromonosporaceae bacterium]|nr:ABC transporter ATP-binding protein [Micromonosporaceae bacterium]
VHADLAAPVPPELSSMPGVYDAVVDGTTITCEVDTERLDAVLRLVTTVGVRSLTCQPPTLEQLFLRHYGRAVANDSDSGDAVRSAAGAR